MDEHIIPITEARSANHLHLLSQEVAAAFAANEHYWVIALIFRCAEPVGPYILDQENLRSAPMAGCFICEQEYTTSLNPVCPGLPS